MIRLLFLSAIHFYWALSGLLRPRCRFWPSCSHFTYAAVERHGILRGLYLGAGRLWRCRPGGGFGYDPVPESA